MPIKIPFLNPEALNAEVERIRLAHIAEAERRRRARRRDLSERLLVALASAVPDRDRRAAAHDAVAWADALTEELSK